MVVADAKELAWMTWDCPFSLLLSCPISFPFPQMYQSAFVKRIIKTKGSHDQCVFLAAIFLKFNRG